MTKIITLISLFLLMNLLTSPTQAQDWANLNRFKAANAELEPPKENEDRVIFMGNSITEGWLADSASFFYTKSYINRGISGQTTPQMLLRFREDVINLNPSVVVILAGINDIAGNTGPSTNEMIMNNLMSMTELAKVHEIKVILCSVLPALEFYWNPEMKPADRVIALNNSLKEYANRNGILYLDYFSAMVDDQKGLKAILTYDGVHPNLKGYKVMQPLAEKAIEKALIKK